MQVMRGDKSYLKNIPILIARIDFKSNISRIRNENDIPPLGFGSLVDEKTWFEIKSRELDTNNKTSLYSKFLSDVESFRRQLLLPEKWSEFISRYIRNGSISQPKKLRSNNYADKPIARLVNSKVQIEINANTTRKDVVDMWPEIVKLQKKIPYRDKSRKRKNLERDILTIKHQELKIPKNIRDLRSDLVQIEEPPTDEALLKSAQRLKKIIRQ